MLDKAQLTILKDPSTSSKNSKSIMGHSNRFDTLRDFEIPIAQSEMTNFGQINQANCPSTQFEISKTSFFPTPKAFSYHHLLHNEEKAFPKPSSLY